MKSLNRYSQLVETIFKERYLVGSNKVEFEREEFIKKANELQIELPKNIGDVIYSFKFRANLPESITNTAPSNKEWVIKNIGRAKYAFVLVNYSRILPDEMMVEIKIPDATPSIVGQYAVSDEQALLTKMRYNRLLDIFTGVTCYSLQNHLRTTVTNVGQVETDEIYVGVDKNGRQFVFPVQAKGGSDELGVVQIEQDIFLCRDKYPNLICRAVAAQFIEDNLIAIFEFIMIKDEIKKVAERHYRLVNNNEISDIDLKRYSMTD